MRRASLYRNENPRIVMRIVPLAIVFLSAAGCAAGSRQTVDLPPPCAPDVAARILADPTSAITPPITGTLSIPPDAPSGVPQSTYRLTFTVGANGDVVPGTVRVAGPEVPGFTRRLIRWAGRLRFGPATAEGCAIPQEMTVTVEV